MTVQTAVKELKRQLKAAAAAKHESDVEWQHRVTRAQNEGKQDAAVARSERQLELDSMRAERDSAADSAAELHGHIEELDAELDRLRRSRTGGAVQQLDALKEKVRVLSERRKANQRTLSDANLADRRAKVAQQQQAALQRAFAESAVRAEAKSSVRDRVAELEQQLAAQQARVLELAGAVAKYKAIAEPPMEYFFHGGSYSLEHDATGLEAITSCHVSACQPGTRALP